MNHSTVTSARALAVAAVLLAGAACTPMTPARSSSAVLAPERTYVIVSKPAQPAALDVVRLFSSRGIPLVDLERDERGVTLRFRTDRKTVAERIVGPLDVLATVAAVADAVDEVAAAKKGRPHHHVEVEHEPTIEHYDLGSVYYVRVEPRGETMTSIAAIGRPTRDGIEACTDDPTITAPCIPLATGPAVQPQVGGYVEAELINGVFSELRLEGSVVGPDVQALETSRRCWLRRREVLAAAARVESPRARAGILRAAPRCDQTVAQP